MEGRIRLKSLVISFARNQRNRTPTQVVIFIVFIVCSVIFLIASYGRSGPEANLVLKSNYGILQQKQDSLNQNSPRPNETLSEMTLLSYVLQVFNKLGEAGNSPDMHSRSHAESMVKSSFQPLPQANISHKAYLFYLDEELKLLSVYDEILKMISQGSKFVRAVVPKTEVTINLAVVACGAGRVQEIKMMLKSAVLFSQDSKLHVIMFSEEESMVVAGEMLLQLRWETNAAGWDFSFELHQDWFPNAQWKWMYAKCATQRLFFPTVLKHMDSVIFMDSDILVVSNLTDMWNLFPKELGTYRLAAMAPNTENTVQGWYGSYSRIPFYIPSGVNAGVMLMNLTQMREFNIVDRSLAAYTLYHEKMELADQDIYNIIFNAHPEKMYLMDCSFNFYWYHCKPRIFQCINDKGENMCFCKPVARSGLKILHGLGGKFHDDQFHFLKDPATYFRKYNLVTDSPLDMLWNLRNEFKQKDNGTLCGPLTADMMYGNAEAFLSKIYNS